MKKQTIFLVTLCCLVVAFTCFTAFAPVSAAAEPRVMPDYVSLYLVHVSNDVHFGNSYFVIYDPSGNVLELISFSNLTAVDTTELVYVIALPSQYFEHDYVNVVFCLDVGQGTHLPIITSVLGRTNNLGVYDNIGARVFLNGFSLPTQLDNVGQIQVNFELVANYSTYLGMQNTITNQAAQITTQANTIAALQAPGQAFETVGLGFAAIGNVLSIEVFPNITIGLLVGIPLIFGIVFFVLRLVRGE